MTVDEIYEQVKDEKLTWAEVIKLLYNNVYMEAYTAALNDMIESSIRDSEEFGKSRFIGICNMSIIKADLIDKARTEHGR